MKQTISLIFIFMCFTWSANSQAQSWVSRLSGSGDYNDKYNVSGLDASGFLILAGYTMNPGNNKDLLVVKLDPVTGDTIWTNVYNGPGNGADEALALFLDNGFIYVTGFQKGSGTGNDFITLKYDGNGVVLWTATYNFPANEYDQSNSITVDASGNVFIAGQSDSDPGPVINDDYVIVKYDAAGNQLWAQRFNGFGNSIDRPSRIQADGGGNVYITGRSSNGFDDDYLTMKYNGSGTLLWSQLYDRLHSDRATDMALNAGTGSVVVTGRSSNGSNYDYVTVKYNASGVQQWARVSDFVDDDRAGKVALDGNNDIYVTGQSDADASANTNYDIVTVKYNSAGTQQWVKTFSGAAGNDDEPNGLTVQSNGTVWVTGQSDSDPSATVISFDMVTLQYDAAGTLQWTRIYNGTGNGNDAAATVTVAPSGVSYVAGYTENNPPQRDAVVTAYDFSGNPNWQKFYSGTGDNGDNVHSLGVDQNNNVYLAGYMVEYGQDRNFAAVKLNPAGDTAWIRTLNGSSPGSTDDAIAVAFDVQGNVYATGYTKNSGSSSDVTTVKYLPGGDTAWVRYYNYAAANESDRGYALAIDNNQNVYVAGRSDQDTSVTANDDFLTLKYNSGGNLQWVVRYNGPANGPDAANAVRVALSGNVYVGGKTFNGTDLDICVIRYDASGQQQWMAVYNSGNGDDEPAEMTMDGAENIYITGYSTSPVNFKKDLVTLKINSAGLVSWAIPFNGQAGGDDEGKSIAVEANGMIAVTGYTDSDTSVLTLNNNYCTLLYDNNGIQQWARFYDGNAGGNDAATGVVADNTGNIFVTGQSDHGSGGLQNYDFVTLKYTAAGTLAGTLVYNGTLDASDVANTLVLHNNDLYVAGGSYGLLSQRDMVTLKYDVTALGTNEQMNPETSLLVFPQPASTKAFVVATGETIKSIRVTDVLGRDTYPMTENQTTEKAILDCTSWSSGLYLINITTGSGKVINSRLIIEK